ncbi:MAG: hypothetical protein EOP11_09175 [Proteobacteria bacterium]|nr:MAG: hypothetical protein EOP11_09175 [Pseudomonadota bacterium]
MIALLALLAALPSASFAADTSGCSQMVERTLHATTSGGNLLTATYAHAPRENCWNANQASLTLAYRFSSAERAAEVALWVNLNGKAQTLPARLSCTDAQSGMQKDTNNQRRFACFAIVVLPAVLGAQSLEVAPSVNGAFDTRGYGENASFQF